MRALVVHIGEGLSHILLATSRRADLCQQAPDRRSFLASIPEEDENLVYDRLYVMHDQIIRNGTDLSLHYMGRMMDDLKESVLRQADEAMEHFRDIAETRTVAISSSLLESREDGRLDPVLDEYQKRSGIQLNILQPQDEALWMLRGVRGLQPAGELACAQIGNWRSALALEIPGKVPQLDVLEEGTTRIPEAGSPAATDQFSSVRPLSSEIPFYLTGETAWLLAAHKIGLSFHDMELLNECTLSRRDIAEMDDCLGQLTIEQRNMIPMINNRGDYIMDGLTLTRRLMNRLGVTEARISSRGVAHGLASHLFYEGRGQS